MASGFWLLVVGLALLGGTVSPAFAQGRLEVVATPPEKAPRPEFVIPGKPAQLTRPREQDFYPEQIKSRHDPAFIAPVTTTIPAGPRTGVRVGLSGWTAPAVRGENVLKREASGAMAFGLSLAWDVDLKQGKPEKQVPPVESLR